MATAPSALHVVYDDEDGNDDVGAARVRALHVKAVDNPPNPFASTEAHYLEGMEPTAALQVFIDNTRQILAKNNSPDIGFDFSVNPYRGCQHACAYCYARPTHEYLSMGAGTDFDRRIVVKPNAPALLRAAFEQKSWRGDTVVFSGVTDCYQPLEASYRLTRGCLEVCVAYKNPVGIITKSPLIERDLDLLLELQRVARVGVSVSIPFFSAENARAIEPGVATPARRLRIIETLSKAGLRVGVMTAPIIPGLNDIDMPQILRAARDAGAVSAGYVLLRLPGNVAGVFEHRLRAAFPDRADKVMAAVLSTRGGDALYNSAYGSRQVGEGAIAMAIASLFSSMTKKLGLNQHHDPSDNVVEGQERAHDGTLWHKEPTTFRRPEAPKRQLSLF
jgi:DNA repair photolyase